MGMARKKRITAHPCVDLLEKIYILLCQHVQNPYSPPSAIVLLTGLALPCMYYSLTGNYNMLPRPQSIMQMNNVLQELVKVS